MVFLLKYSERTDVQDGINFCRLDALQNNCLVCVDPLADISCVAQDVVLWIFIENRIFNSRTACSWPSLALWVESVPCLSLLRESHNSNHSMIMVVHMILVHDPPVKPLILMCWDCKY